jgi:hypothetical protein
VFQLEPNVVEKRVLIHDALYVPFDWKGIPFEQCLPELSRIHAYVATTTLMIDRQCRIDIMKWQYPEKIK